MLGSYIDPDSIYLLKSLTHHNELIYLHIEHPYETSPNREIGFIGRIIGSANQYRDEYEQMIGRERRNLESIGVHHLRIMTTEIFDTRLNYFFKYQYVR
jgi:hypothetical protein